MVPTALIPVRIAPTAKRRLAHVLGPEERMDLVRRLFDHVAEVLVQAGLEVIALSPHPLDARIEVWRDEARGLNLAVGRALTRLSTPALVVHADLPQLDVPDVERVLDDPADVVIARSHDGGTNGLLLRRPIEPAYGPGSAHAHAMRARAAGYRAHVVDVPGFARDIDDEPALSAYGASFLRPRP